MNDFTKEELTRIAVWGDLHVSGEGIAWPVMGTKKANKELIKKIQSMIDNYCETNPPTMASYCCKICNKEWIHCECRK